MTTAEHVQDLLIKGRRIGSDKYVAHCQIHHEKTFYFLCERLCQEPGGFVIPSSELRDYIHQQLRQRNIAVANRFNPEGWFGKAWTEWIDPATNQKHFRDEYVAVLGRTGTEPYSYQLSPAWEAFVRTVFQTFQNRG